MNPPTAGMNSSVVPSWRPASVASATSSSGVADREGTGSPLRVVVRRRLRRGEAEAAGLQGLAEQARHRVDLLGLRRVADRVVAHHHAAQRAVADEEPGVHGERPVEAAQVLAEGAPVVGHAREQRLKGHALDAGEHPGQVLGLARLDRARS